MKQRAGRVAVAALAMELLAACATHPEDELRVKGADSRRPDYIATDCARIVEQAGEIYRREAPLNDAIYGSRDARIADIESRGAIMGCNPRR